MASINRGDNTAAFGQDFLRIYLNNPNELYIKKAIFQINNNLEKEFDEPVFPLRINFTGSETELLSQINTCKLALWDQYGRRRTADGKFTFFCKENTINAADDPTYAEADVEANETAVYFDLEDAEFACEFVVNATPAKMSELQQDIYLMTPDKIIGGTNIRTNIDSSGNVIISAELDAKQSYNALVDKPSINGQTLQGNIEIHLEDEIPQADWYEEDTTSKAYIKNKPILSVVAISGNYKDLINKPVYPTKVSDLENDLNYVTKDVTELTNFYTKAEVDVLVSHEIDFKPVYEKIEETRLELKADIDTVDAAKVSTDTFNDQVNVLLQADASIRQSLNTSISAVNTEIEDLKEADAQLSTSLISAVNTLNASIVLKADQTAVDEINNKLDNFVTDTVFYATVATKLDKADLGKANLTIKANDTEVGVFNANQKADVSINLNIPVKVSDLQQDIAYITEADLSKYITLDTLNERLAEKVDNSQLGMGILTLKQNGESIGTFNANETQNKNINIITATKLSDLDQDVDYLVESDLDTINANITSLQSDSTLLFARISDAEIAINKKLDYSNTKSLVDNTEINRLKTVHNYDDTALTNKVNELQEKVDNFDTDISNKVDKIDGKGLSTNDYTDLDKDKLTSAYTKSNLNTDNITQLTTNVGDLTTNVNALQITTNNLSTLISDESTVRLNTDIQLQTQIDALQAKSTVVDIVADISALDNYDTSKLQLNDVICVLKDENHQGAVSYYRWNMSAFTYVGSEGTYYKKAESDARYVAQTTKINGKELSTDISLTYTDVNALPASTVIGDGVLVFKVNGEELPEDQRFTANQIDNTVVELTIPTKLSELSNEEANYYVTKNVLIQTYLGTPQESYGDGENTLLWDKAYFLQDKIAVNSTRIDALEGNLPEVALTGNYYDLLNLPTTISSNYKTIAKDTSYTGYIDNTFIAEFKAKTGYITSTDISDKFALKTDIPTAVSELENDRGYITSNTLGKGTISLYLEDVKLDSFNVNTKEDLTITIPVDTELSNTSINPVQNKLITAAINLKANDTDVVKLTGNQSISGNKSFSDDVTLYKGYAVTPADTDNSTKIATTEFVKNQDYCVDSSVVHNTGNETINGTKTFADVILTSGTTTTPADNDNSTKIATTAFVKNQSYAQDSGVVHNTGNETINGYKTFAETTTFNGITKLGSYAHVNTPDGTVDDAVVNVAYLTNIITQLNNTIADLQDRVAALEGKS